MKKKIIKLKKILKIQKKKMKIQIFQQKTQRNFPKIINLKFKKIFLKTIRKKLIHKSIRQKKIYKKRKTKDKL